MCSEPVKLVDPMLRNVSKQSSVQLSVSRIVSDRYVTIGDISDPWGRDDCQDSSPVNTDYV